MSYICTRQIKIGFSSIFVTIRCYLKPGTLSPQFPLSTVHPQFPIPTHTDTKDRQSSVLLDTSTSTALGTRYQHKTPSPQFSRKPSEYSVPGADCPPSTINTVSRLQPPVLGGCVRPTLNSRSLPTLRASCAGIAGAGHVAEAAGRGREGRGGAGRVGAGRSRSLRLRFGPTPTLPARRVPGAPADPEGAAGGDEGGEPATHGWPADRPRRRTLLPRREGPVTRDAAPGREAVRPLGRPAQTSGSRLLSPPPASRHPATGASGSGTETGIGPWPCDQTRRVGSGPGLGLFPRRLGPNLRRPPPPPPVRVPSRAPSTPAAVVRATGAEITTVPSTLRVDPAETARSAPTARHLVGRAEGRRSGRAEIAVGGRCVNSGSASPPNPRWLPRRRRQPEINRSPLSPTQTPLNAPSRCAGGEASSFGPGPRPRPRLRS